MQDKISLPDGRRVVFRLESGSYQNTRGSVVNAGPYSVGIGCECRAFDEQAHPTPRQDAGLSLLWCDMLDSGKYEEYFFGFKDMRTFRSWWAWDSRAAECLENAVDCRIGVYAVPQDEVHDGQFQSIFRDENAELIDTMEPWEEEWHGLDNAE